jgi:hypothetical protein
MEVVVCMVLLDDLHLKPFLNVVYSLHTDLFHIMTPLSLQSFFVSV